VLDFGKEVGGTPYAVVSSSTPPSGSSVTLRVATSEDVGEEGVAGVREHDAGGVGLAAPAACGR
jgi:hypothetical protein